MRPGFLKMPEPMTEPTPQAMAAIRPSSRLSSRDFDPWLSVMTERIIVGGRGQINVSPAQGEREVAAAHREDENSLLATDALSHVRGLWSREAGDPKEVSAANPANSANGCRRIGRSGRFIAPPYATLRVHRKAAPSGRATPAPIPQARLLHGVLLARRRTARTAYQSPKNASQPVTPATESGCPTLRSPWSSAGPPRSPGLTGRRCSLRLCLVIRPV